MRHTGFALVRAGVIFETVGESSPSDSRVTLSLTQRAYLGSPAFTLVD